MTKRNTMKEHQALIEAIESLHADRNHGTGTYTSYTGGFDHALLRDALEEGYFATPFDKPVVELSYRELKRSDEGTLIITSSPETVRALTEALFPNKGGIRGGGNM